MLSMTTDVLFHKTTINYDMSRFSFVCVCSLMVTGLYTVGYQFSSMAFIDESLL